ncbi:MAG: hypothetical protein BWY93_00423 [Euryarchaeota archaeon ADurb.BinA087]|nr:MAG: hypothetical protein BWY93_00423 [Euryarchaeota archaeon ADurb.BinA087]
MPLIHPFLIPAINNKRVNEDLLRPDYRVLVTKTS